MSAHFSAAQPGAVVLVKKGDQTLLRRAYGLANVARKTPLSPDMVFKLGSVTKQFTAAAILQLAEKKKLSLDDELAKYVPQYGHADAHITLEQLLRHTSGVPSYTETPGFAIHERDDLSHDQVLALFKDLALDFPPGTKWKYSNSNYYLLGMVIEKVTGQPYARYLDEHIFRPLKMAHTGYGDAAHFPADVVIGYDHADDSYTPSAPVSMAAPFSAGAVVSTVDDLARWARAIDAHKILQPASWERAISDGKLPDGKTTHYGLGWGLSEWNGHHVISHGGAIPGFSADVLLLPDEHVFVAILCNALPAADPPEGLALKLAALAIGQPIVDPKTVAVDGAALDKFAGVYKVDDQVRMFVRHDGDHLTSQRSPGSLLVLYPLSPTQFFVKDTPIRFAFMQDNGKITGVDIRNPTVRWRIARAPTSHSPPSAKPSPSTAQRWKNTLAATSWRRGSPSRSRTTAASFMARPPDSRASSYSPRRRTNSF